MLFRSTAAADTSFVARVQDAIVQSAIAIYAEATMLSAHLQAGVAVTSLPLAVNLGSTIAAGTVVLVGGDDPAVVAVGGAPSGAPTIPVTAFTPKRLHVVGEPVSPPTVAGHAVRSGFANAVLGSPARYASLFASALASQGIDKNSLDSDITNMVASVWNPLAGA